jgi:hypothetical protein
MSRWKFIVACDSLLSVFFTGEINKHMQDLTAEFEDLFDPYLPVASKLKMKACPGLGVIGWLNCKHLKIKIKFLKF